MLVSDTASWVLGSVCWPSRGTALRAGEGSEQMVVISCRASVEATCSWGEEKGKWKVTKPASHMSDRQDQEN